MTVLKIKIRRKEIKNNKEFKYCENTTCNLVLKEYLTVSWIIIVVSVFLNYKFKTIFLSNQFKYHIHKACCSYSDGQVIKFDT